MAERILYVPPEEHRHDADVPGEWIESLRRHSMFPRYGTVAVCECGTVIVYRGSSDGLVKWYPETKRERRKRLRRDRRG